MGDTTDIRELLKQIPPADQPAINLSIEATDPLTSQQLTAAFMDEIFATNGQIDRDPYEQLKFANKLMDYQGALLEVSWSMREKLELARNSVNGVAGWPTLIDETVELTAQLQILADRLRELGEAQKQQALFLIQQTEQFNP